jgi:transposase
LEASPGRPAGQAGMDRIPHRHERSLRAVKNRVARYNRGGVEALRERPRGGRPRSLSPEHYPRLRQRLEPPPRPEDGVCAIRAADVRRILEQEFGVRLMGPDSCPAS